MIKQKKLTKIHEAIGSEIDVLAVELCQPNFNFSSAALKGLGASLGASVASGAPVAKVELPLGVYAVVTSDAFVVVEGVAGGMGVTAIGKKVLLTVPLRSVALVLKGGLLKKLAIQDIQTNEQIIELAFKLRWKGRASIVRAAVQGGARVAGV